jgi:hypothetical protein
MIPFIFLYGGDHSVVVNSDRYIHCCHSTRIVIIHLIPLVFAVFLGVEKLDQTKAHQRCP